MIVDNVIANVAAAILSGTCCAFTLLISSILLRHLCCDRLCPAVRVPQFQRLASSANTVTTTTTITSLRSHKRSNPWSSSSSGTTEIHCFFRNIAAICCLLFCLVCICVTCNAVLFAMLNSDALAKKLRLIGFMVWICYFLGRVLLNLLFIGRLYFTFRSSAMAYSARTMCVLFSLWCLTPCSAIASITMQGLRTLPHIYGVAVGTFFIFMDIVLSCLLLFLYLKKLHELVMMQLNAKVTDLMTRYTLLYIFCFCSSFLVFILLVVAPVASPSLNENLSAAAAFSYQSFLWLLVAIDSLVNTLCLWLNFAFAKKWYTMFCRSCHLLCGRCCNQCCATQNSAVVELDEFDPGTRVETETLKDWHEKTDQSSPEPSDPEPSDLEP